MPGRGKYHADPQVFAAGVHGAAMRPGRPYNAAHPLGKNPGDVWQYPTRPLKEAHFAAFPVDIPLRCVAAGCAEARAEVLRQHRDGLLPQDGKITVAAWLRQWIVTQEEVRGLRAALNAAVRAQEVPRNVAALADVPRESRRRVKPWPPELLGAWLDAIAGSGCTRCTTSPRSPACAGASCADSVETTLTSVPVALPSVGR